MRVAIIHDWLLGMRGGERCLEALCRYFPEADIYTLFHRHEGISPQINAHNIWVSPLQQLPHSERYYRYLLPFFKFGIDALSRSVEKNHQTEPYDLIVSVSHCVAKNIRVPAGVKHLCYCLTPMRYIWDQYDAYFENHPLEPLVRRLLPSLRRWDVGGSESVDRFIGISDFVRARIGALYRREADVVYPPVTSEWIPRLAAAPGRGFLSVNALVPYKNVELIIRSFNRLPYELTVVGCGPLERKLKGIAGPNIRFLSNLSDDLLGKLYGTSRALVFAAEEDFGMTPVEMQAAGRPVICYARGGVLETVIAGESKPTGVYFPELSEEAVIAAVRGFVEREGEFHRDDCVRQAERFSLKRFYRELEAILEEMGVPLELRAEGRKEPEAEPGEPGKQEERRRAGGVG